MSRITIPSSVSVSNYDISGYSQQTHHLLKLRPMENYCVESQSPLEDQKFPNVNQVSLRIQHKTGSSVTVAHMVHTDWQPCADSTSKDSIHKYSTSCVF